MDKLIIQLNQRKGRYLTNMTYYKFLVAMSRCKARTGIRIMPVKDKKGLNYLKPLKPSADLRIFLAGIDPQTHEWSAELSTEERDNLAVLGALPKPREKAVKPQARRASLAVKVRGKAIVKTAVERAPAVSKNVFESPTSRRQTATSQHQQLIQDAVWNSLPDDVIQETRQFMEENEVIVSQCGNNDPQHPRVSSTTHGYGFTVTARQFSSLARHQWLYGEVIDAFINLCFRHQSIDGDAPWKRVLATVFHAFIDNGHFTAQQTINWDEADLGRTILIPVHRPGHWILLQLMPHERRLLVLDSYRGQHATVTNNIVRWYGNEYTRITGRTVHEHEWDIVWGTRLPGDLPRQTDGSSCGVFTAMTAWYLLYNDRLPTTADWTQSNVPTLRIFMAHMLHVAYTTARREDEFNFFDEDVRQRAEAWDRYKATLAAEQLKQQYELHVVD